jgi:hypothetical protein
MTNTLNLLICNLQIELLEVLFPLVKEGNHHRALISLLVQVNGPNRIIESYFDILESYLPYLNVSHHMGSSEKMQFPDLLSRITDNIIINSMEEGIKKSDELNRIIEDAHIRTGHSGIQKNITGGDEKH